MDYESLPEAEQEKRFKEFEPLIKRARNKGWWMGFWAACITMLITQLLMSLIIKYCL